MNVVYSICCGVDVHKSFIVATLIKEGDKGPVYSKRRFSTFNSSIKEFKKWLLENNCKNICLESTGKYWVPIYNILEDAINITVANPKWVRAIKGKKDDVKDSKWIGDLFRMGIVNGSFVPDKEIRILREYTRYLTKLTNMRSSERNRYQNAFTVANISLDSIVTDVFGVFSTNVIDYLLTNQEDNIDFNYILSLRTKGMKATNEDIINAIDGYHFEESQKIRISLIKEHMNIIDGLIAKIKKVIDKLVEPYEGSINLLITIPGVDRRIAINIIAEIGTEMSVFSSAKQLSAWAGLSPTNNESAGKKKSTRTARAGAYIKPNLVEASNAAIKCSKTPYYQNKFNGISTRRGNKRAKIAIARMMLEAVYYMLSRGEVFNPKDLQEVVDKSCQNPKRLAKQLKQEIKFLEEQGYVVTPKTS